ncbi:MAG: hypothetical protein PVG67_12815 [Desulfobacterales bacterium]|jgi:DNA polymerase (family 10)
MFLHARQTVSADGILPIECHLNIKSVADLREIRGANSFRVRAYRNAAGAIGSLATSVAELIAEGKPLTDFSGIGKDLAKKIRELVKTDKLSQLNELEKDLPPGLLDLLRIPGLGLKWNRSSHEARLARQWYCSRSFRWTCESYLK